MLQTSNTPAMMPAGLTRHTLTRRTPRTKHMAATAGSRQDSITDSIAEHFRRSCETLDRAASDGAMMQAMIHATQAMAAALRSGNKILVAGHRGGAARRPHIGGGILAP